MCFQKNFCFRVKRIPFHFAHIENFKLHKTGELNITIESLKAIGVCML